MPVSIAILHEVIEKSELNQVGVRRTVQREKLRSSGEAVQSDGSLQISIRNPYKEENLQVVCSDSLTVKVERFF